MAVPPPVRSKGGTGGSRQASARTLAIAGGAIAVVIVAVVLAIVLTHSNSSSAPSGYDGPTIGVVAGTPHLGNSAKSILLDAPQVATLLHGIPQKGFVLGNPNAPVTLVEYIDVQCPYCDQFETSELPTLIKKYIRPGKLKVQLHVWDIIDGNDGGDDSLRGQKATIAAADQNKAFNFLEVLYENQAEEGTGWLNDGMISNIAASVDKLDTAQFAKDANSSATGALIRQTDNYAQSRSDFTGTPVLLLAKGNAAPVFYYAGWGNGLGTPTALDSAINKLLK